MKNPFSYKKYYILLYYILPVPKEAIMAITRLEINGIELRIPSFSNLYPFYAIFKSFKLKQGLKSNRFTGAVQCGSTKEIDTGAVSRLNSSKNKKNVVRFGPPVLSLVKKEK